jgi:hypothetical protein
VNTTSTSTGFVLATLAPLLLLGACSSASTESDTPPAQSSSAPVSSPSVADEPVGDTVPALIGTWDYEFDRAERRVILKDFASLVDDADRVVVRLAFVDQGVWWLGFLFDGELFLLDGVPEGDGGTYSIDGERLSTVGAHGEAFVTYDWSLEGSKLTLANAEQCTALSGGVPGCLDEKGSAEALMRLVTEHTFTRSGNDTAY